MGVLKIKITNILSPNPFIIEYKKGGSAYPLNSGYTEYNTVYTGTTEIEITGSTISYGDEYWVKLIDVITGQYIIKNIYLNDEVAYDICLNPPSPSPTPTSSVTPVPTPDITSSVNITPSVTPSVTP